MVVDRLLPSAEGAELVSLVREFAQAELAPRAAGDVGDEQDRDQGGQHERDTGDEPTEADENLDSGGEGPRDTGDES